MITDKDRAEFEAAMQTELHAPIFGPHSGDVLRLREDGNYYFAHARIAWIAWQAARSRSGAVPAEWREAMDLGAQMLSWGTEDGLTPWQEHDIAEHQKCMFALVRAAAPEPTQGEPIAWMYTNTRGERSVVIGPRTKMPDGFRSQPLYLSADTPRSGDAPEVYGWAVLDKNGCTERVVSRVHYEFNCTEPVIRAGVAHDLLPYLDREYRGAAPHRIVTLYTAPPADAPTFQARVQPWMLECFGAEIASDRVERNHRFAEESMELVQANGMPRDDAHALVDYVYNRPAGELQQEVGGVMVTLAALCLASNVDMHAAGDVELARISEPGMVEKIRAKQAAKPRGSALPVAVAPADARDGELERLRALLNTPELHDFAQAVVLEAAHQRERWGTSHDSGKAPADWFWLVGYLAGKALAAHIAGNSDKALHHTISTSAALANWHTAITGEHTAMQPGHAPSAVLAEQAEADRAMGDGT